MARPLKPIDMIGYPEKFELALRYGEGPLQQNPALSDSDKLLFYAVSMQAQKGPCKEPRPSMWDVVAKAKWNAWNDLGKLSAFEAMFKYVSAIESLDPDWWKWPPLGLEQPEEPSAAAPAAPAAPAAAAAAPASAKSPPPKPPSGPVTFVPASPKLAAAAAPAAPPVDEPDSPPRPDSGMAPLQLAPNALALGGWSCLPDSGAPARYRHACAVVGARLFVYGGRGNSGRLASGLHQLDLLTGRWSVPAIAGEPPDLRWGHSMNTFRQYVIVFGGHRRRGCLNDTTMLDTEAMQWDTPLIEGVLPPPRGNHAAAVVSEKLWLFGGDAATFGVLPHTVWCLPLASPGSPAASWTAINATGEPAPPCSDHAAVAIGARVLLLGGSSPQGYLELQRIPTFHTDTLSWSRLVTSGAVPSARAGHVACAITGSGTSFQVFLFGGGNSATGFDDIVVLRGGAAGARWTRLQSSSAAELPKEQPPPTEGAAISSSGGMLLIFGGYTGAGATRRCYAWGCEPHDDESASGAPKTAPTGPGEGVASSSDEALVLLACPADAPANRHATAAVPAFTDALPGAIVVPTPPADWSAEVHALVSVADSPTQALSLLTQTLQGLQLQRTAFSQRSASLLARARLLAAVQPCVQTLRVGGQPRFFACFWVGVVDVQRGKTVVGSSMSREISAEQAAAGWGKDARGALDGKDARGALDEDTAAILHHAWRALLRGF